MLQTSVPNILSIFQTYVASVFICMLHMFHTYVASVLSECCICLQWPSSVFMCFCNYFRLISSVSLVFRHILQVLHLDVSKVDRVLHMLQCDPPAVAAGGGARGRAGRRRRVGSGGGVDTVWGRVGADAASGQSGCRRGRLSERPGH